MLVGVECDMVGCYGEIYEWMTETLYYNCKMAAVRKISLFPIIFTSVGLLLVVIGFAISSHKNGSPIHVYLAVCVSGILIILLACAHAVLWYPLSAVLGAVIAFFNAFFLTGLGRILYSNGNSIREGFLMNTSDSTTVDPDSLSYRLEFTGAVIATFFWIAVMIMWQFYDAELLRGTRHAMLRGIARKLTLPFIALTGIGWFLVVVGFGVASAKGEPSAAEPSAYPYWAVSISGPFTIVVAIVYAILSRESLSAILGIITTCLNVVFLTGLGMIVWSTQEELLKDNSNLPKVEFVGAVFAALFWTPVMILWHFFDYEVKRQEQYLAL